jgi:Predicted xylanase/chitin deacetylase
VNQRRKVHTCFPNGAMKALSMSYDDGSEHDRRLVGLFDAYGLRGTFHLTSSTLGQEYRVGRDEVARLYRRHEVACHGATHADLGQLSDADVDRELRDDKSTLEALVGQPVRGLAYPFGTHDARIEAMAAAAGFAYGRGITDTDDLSPPDAPMRLTTTCHHNQAMDWGRRLIACGADALQWMRVRGHSFELDGFMTADRSKDWAYMEAFCRMMGAASGIWHAPLIEVLDYLVAAAQVRVDDGGALCNPTSIPVWVRGDDGSAVELPPQTALPNA